MRDAVEAIARELMQTYGGKGWNAAYRAAKRIAAVQASGPMRRAVHDWLTDTAPLTVKMTIRPEHVDDLVTRLVAASWFTEPETKDGPWTDDTAKALDKF